MLFGTLLVQVDLPSYKPLGIELVEQWQLLHRNGHGRQSCSLSACKQNEGSTPAENSGL